MNSHNLYLSTELFFPFRWKVLKLMSNSVSKPLTVSVIDLFLLEKRWCFTVYLTKRALCSAVRQR